MPDLAKPTKLGQSTGTMKFLRIKKPHTPTKPNKATPLTAGQKSALLKALTALECAVKVGDIASSLGDNVIVSWPDGKSTRFGLVPNGFKSTDATEIKLLVSTCGETTSGDYPTLGYRTTGETITLASGALQVVTPEELVTN